MQTETIKLRVIRYLAPVAILLAGLGLYRLTAPAPSGDPISAHRDAPWTITARQQDPRVVSDTQLFQLLERMKPPREADSNKWIHALRLWGPQADFFDSRTPSGRELLNYFLDDNEFRARAGQDAPPLFRIGEDGEVEVRSWASGDPHRRLASHHRDDILATIAESGVPLDAALITRDGATTVRALLDSTMRRFHFGQHEYEWSTISYARYLFPRREWVNQYGESITLERLIENLYQRPLHHGPCNGLHRLEALVVLYRADEEARVLSPRTRALMLTHMKRVSQLLAAAQHPDGYWTRRWPLGARAAGDRGRELYSKILVTGHHLEWLALAPPEVQPPREQIVRAAQWLTRAMLAVDDKELSKAYGPFSHAVRALCLWRAKDPYETWRAGRERAQRGPREPKAPSSAGV